MGEIKRRNESAMLSLGARPARWHFRTGACIQTFSILFSSSTYIYICLCEHVYVCVIACYYQTTAPPALTWIFYDFPSLLTPSTHTNTHTQTNKKTYNLFTANYKFYYICTRRFRKYRLRKLFKEKKIQKYLVG